MGKLDDQEVVEFLRKPFFKPFRKAIYGMLLAFACTEYPYVFYGYDLGLGGKTGFTVSRLYKIARKLLEIPFEKSKVAYQTYDKMVEDGLARAIKTKRGGREMTIYTITEEGKRAMKESLENIQKIIQLSKEKLEVRGRIERVTPRLPFFLRYLRPWKEISDAWQIDFRKAMEKWAVMHEKGELPTEQPP
jgi:hypothetical protein